ncbi:MULTISPECIES: DUF1214 domain-containing protein [Mycobacterium avium complex (MAC)]|uniref:DUF1214 domain-containing protein n=4 Tax=Mycobacterium avium TaxID=1764 RepID=A0A0H2ZSB6_MYCA1|nr:MULTISPECIES: DUF1214 domain-containing protein [Mycobacterium avium complex (MAC)]ETA92653.1 hypothetical protein O984_11905 [Mycobacterium avium 05-4293]ETB41526.1 hypothetical protein N602_10425 [Mycobacterium avium subsp. hominissuis 10-5606]EUA40848.1 hypothetical protein I549_3887 [Mycobacterium avium subsp. avium 2285 (R)]ABK64521.1 conserved hypothetical protein [Mycobacterium avium 104]ETZ42595.1 hypothetical protein L837_4846 [Mycobacterium avium MAV_061107_1842]
MSDPENLAWLPFTIAEATTADKPDTPDLAEAWSHLLARLGEAAQMVESDPANQNRIDAAAGLRHLLVLLAAGIDEALRFDPDPVLRVQRTSTDDVVTWGMECPDCLYTRAVLRGGESYRLFGNRGTARYVGLQTMNGIAATANCLVDELETDAEGNFEVVLSASEQTRPGGNWMRIDGEHPTLTVRHFFYDWDVEVPSSLHIEQLGDVTRPARYGVDPELAVTRQLVALGDFVKNNLTFFLQFGAAAPKNGFLPAIDRTDMGAAAENRPVIGRWELCPNEALIVEVEPPQGIYWSFSIGNPWWETIHYGRHQSSLNAHQTAVDADGMVRVVLCAEDPGVANWLDTAGHGNGPIILRCVRTTTAPTPRTRVVAFDDISSELPSDTARVTAGQRESIVAARRRAVHERFGR